MSLNSPNFLNPDKIPILTEPFIDFCLPITNVSCYFSSMEKLKPHHPLHEIIQLASTQEFVVFTTVARKGAAELGMSVNDMFSVLTNLTMRDFYKSMTSYSDHTSWQDVYRPVFRGITLYLKLTIIPEHNLLVVSFKRR